MSPTIQASVVFLDSGVGGLPYLECARDLLPGTELHYIADDAGFPYGTKVAHQIEDILLDRTRRLRARLLPAAIVIACNTASQVGLPSLRRAHPDIPIVGTVPAIKPAAFSTRTGKIGVIATEQTVADPYIDNLIARYASDVEVVKIAAQDLVTFVERHFLASSEAERAEVVDPYVRTFIHAGVDRIILACTHFLHLEKDFIASCARLGANDVQIVDSRQGVARRLAQLAKDIGLDSASGARNSGTGRFFLTGEPPFDPNYRLWAERFRLSAPERL